MNEVDKLYHEWREEQKRISADWRQYLRDQNPRWYCDDERYISAQAVEAESKSLKDYIERNESSMDYETKTRVDVAKKEIKRRQEKYNEFAVKVKKAQFTTRGKTPLEDVIARQEEINKGLINLKKETLKTKGRKTMAQSTKTVKVNTKIDVTALVQAKMA